MNKSYGLHSAAFVIKNQTYLLIGPHNSGKTSIITNLINKKYNLGLLTDDWLLLKKNQQDFFAEPITNMVSNDCEFNINCFKLL